MPSRGTHVGARQVGTAGWWWEGPAAAGQARLRYCRTGGRQGAGACSSVGFRLFLLVSPLPHLGATPGESFASNPGGSPLLGCLRPISRVVGLRLNIYRFRNTTVAPTRLAVLAASRWSKLTTTSGQRSAAHIDFISAIECELLSETQHVCQRLGADAQLVRLWGDTNTALIIAAGSDRHSASFLFIRQWKCKLSAHVPQQARLVKGACRDHSDAPFICSLNMHGYVMQ